MSPRSRAGLALSCIIAVVGCTDAAPTRPRRPAPTRSEEAVAEEATAAAAQPIWAKRIEGTSGGAQYALLYPSAPWNGRLVLIVHGLVDPRTPIALPATTAGVDTLGKNGNAVAFSSFSENGWAVKDGAQRTHELRDIFATQFGEPSRVYLYGQSMGSLIALKLAESFPTQYDGVLAECGILGGTLARMRYMLDVRTLFDYFYPGVLPGGTLSVPETVDLRNDIRLPARDALSKNIKLARLMATFTQTPVPAKDVSLPPSVNADGTPSPATIKDSAEVVAAIEDQLFRHAREVNDIMARGHGEPPVGNRDIVYQGALDKNDLARLNAAVPRYDAGRFATHYASQYYEPSGDLHVPVVTLYTPRDPALPGVMSEELYAARVAAAQHDKFLRRTRTAKVEFGHCTGVISDRQAAFQTLLHWVEPTAP